MSWAAGERVRYKPPMNKDSRSGAKDRHYARLRRAHRERTGGGPVEAHPLADGHIRLYGLHTVREALGNPKRVIHHLQITKNAANRLGLKELSRLPYPASLAEPKELDALCGDGVVHQGAVLETEPLKPKPLSALGDTNLVLILDQVTDPHNVGAILRSAVAFGAGALVTTSRHSPSESGVLAKSASGALEHIDLIEVRNLAGAIRELSAAGFLTIGLDSAGPLPLEQSPGGARIALVLGAEGKGLRQKTRETVKVLARLDMPGAIRSLNVSNAAAVALYIARGKLRADNG